jgi:hypothetical protein
LATPISVKIDARAVNDELWFDAQTLHALDNCNPCEKWLFKIDVSTFVHWRKALRLCGFWGVAQHAAINAS